MKRILIVRQDAAHLGPSHDSGLLARYWQQQGLDVVTLRLLPPGDPVNTDDRASADAYTIAWPHPWSWAAWQSIREQTRRLQPDEIHVWGIDSRWLARVLASFCRCRVREFVATSGRSNGSLEKWCERRGRGELVRTFRHPRLADRCQPAWSQGHPPGRLPWFRYTDSRSPVDREQLREQWNIPAGATVVGTIGPQVPRTNIKDFIWAADLLRCIRDDVYWIVFGTGRGNWRLKKYASQLDIAERIDFRDFGRGEPCPLAGLDLYVQPSDWFDDFSGLRAAISAGRPVIGISQSVHAGLVRHHRSGYLVERGARNEIARCVNRLASETAIAAGMQQQALAIAGHRLASLEEASAMLWRESLAPPLDQAG